LDGAGHRMRQRLPGLAVDPGGRRAYVVDHGLVAEVDLRTLAVGYHAPTRSTSLLARIRDWLEPAAHAKGGSARTRSARWLGGGLIAVTGADAQHDRVLPAGLDLVDTRDWSIRTIDDDASDVRVAGDLLLATTESTGLIAYGFDGDRRFELFGDRVAWIEQVHDGRAYVAGLQADGRPAPLRVVDLATGRPAGERADRLPWLLLDAASGWWDG
jgi:hypothetical protein